MTDLLIVGEAFGHGRVDPKGALVSGSATRLSRLAGIDHEEFLARSLRVNFVNHPEDYGDNDQLVSAVVRLARLVERHKIRRTVILGTKVAEVLGVTHWPLFAWRDWWTCQMARSPHPSGRNRFWNDTDATREAQDFWKETFS